jgi:hypothetical protein
MNMSIDKNNRVLRYRKLALAESNKERAGLLHRIATKWSAAFSARSTASTPRLRFRSRASAAVSVQA